MSSWEQESGQSATEVQTPDTDLVTPHSPASSIRESERQIIQKLELPNTSLYRYQSGICKL